MLEPLVCVLWGWCFGVVFISLASCQGLREQVSLNCPRVHALLAAHVPQPVKRAFPSQSDAPPSGEVIPRYSYPRAASDDARAAV